MSRTKQILYGAVGLAALAALLVDRFVLSDGEAAHTGPAAARAAAPSVTGQPTSAPALPEDLDIEQILAARPTHADHWPASLDNVPIRRDPLGPTSAFVERLTPPEPPPEADIFADAPQTQPDNTAFLQAHEVQGVLVRGDFRAAIISGRVVALGETIDGYKVVGISAEEITLEGPQGTLALPVARKP